MKPDSPLVDNRKGRSRRRLLLATLVAFLVALMLLFTFILPAEFGVDPTGIGRLTGLSKLTEGVATTNQTENVTTQYVYQATWPVASTEVLNQTGYLKAGAKRLVQAPLQVPNLTRLTAYLTWVDANETAGQKTDPDIFEIQVLSPKGQGGTAVLGRNPTPGGPGSATASFDWRSAPSSIEIDAADATAAQQQAVEAEPEDRSSWRTWQVNVTLLVAGGAHAGGVPVTAGPVDDGNDWRLVLVAESFKLDAEALRNALVRTDTTTIKVPPGRGLEYKLHANETQFFEYAWSAGNVSVYFEFHGEKDGDTSGAFTSHKRGRASRDSGEFTAPFTGRHGWYFENQGRNELTIEVRTKGVYTVLGVK